MNQRRELLRELSQASRDLMVPVSGRLWAESRRRAVARSAGIAAASLVCGLVAVSTSACGGATVALVRADLPSAGVVQVQVSECYDASTAVAYRVVDAAVPVREVALAPDWFLQGCSPAGPWQDLATAELPTRQEVVQDPKGDLFAATIVMLGPMFLPTQGLMLQTHDTQGSPLGIVGVIERSNANSTQLATAVTEDVLPGLVYEEDQIYVLPLPSYTPAMQLSIVPCDSQCVSVSVGATTLAPGLNTSQLTPVADSVTAHLLWAGDWARAAGRMAQEQRMLGRTEEGMAGLAELVSLADPNQRTSDCDIAHGAWQPFCAPRASTDNGVRMMAARDSDVVTMLRALCDTDPDAARAWLLPYGIETDACAP